MDPMVAPVPEKMVSIDIFLYTFSRAFLGLPPVGAPVVYVLGFIDTNLSVRILNRSLLFRLMGESYAVVVRISVTAGAAEFD